MSEEKIKTSPFRVREIDELYNNVKKFRSTNYSRKLLKFISKFLCVGPYNAMLVFMQKPGSQYVATADVWKNRFGRTPKPYARPLIILKQFGPVSFVFELNDTERENFPQDLLNPFKTDGNLSPDKFYNLMKGLEKEAIGYNEQNYGTNLAGKLVKRARVVKRDKKKKIIVGQNKKYEPIMVESLFEIVINKNLPQTEKVATIFHELGHYFCGHLNVNGIIKHIPERATLDSSVEEFEAETVCWLLCERLGIKNPSEKYLKGYLKNNEEIPEGISYDAILKSCGKIEQMLEGKYITPKDLIVKSSDKEISLF